MTPCDTDNRVTAYTLQTEKYRLSSLSSDTVSSVWSLSHGLRLRLSRPALLVLPRLPSPTPEQCCPLPGKRVGNPTFRFFFRVVWERKKWDFPLLGFPRHTPEYIFIIFEYTGSVAETRPFRPQSPGFGTRFSPHPLGILMKSGWDDCCKAQPPSSKAQPERGPKSPTPSLRTPPQRVGHRGLCA